MIELSAQIEELLLQHGCVILPHFGAFVSQHVAARYVEEEHLYLPPTRSVGFNPQLTANDGLLTHSYMRYLNVDFEQAEETVDKEVSHLVHKLMEDGRFEVDNVGTLVQHDNGTLDFFPCEAGVISPEFYGLDAIDIMTLGKQMADEPKLDLPKMTLDEARRRKHHHKHNDHVVIRLRRQWIYNAVGVVAAILLFFLISTPTGNPAKAVQEASLEQTFMPRAEQQGKMHACCPTNATSAARPSHAASDAPKSDPIGEKAAKPAEKTTEQDADAHENTNEVKRHFCLVLASSVSKRNAETFIKMMKEKGFDDVSIYEHGKMRRVVYASFPDAAAATKKLNALHHISEFSSAWVYEIK